MAEELKIVLEVEGANKVTTALDNTSEALKNTADEAKKAGTALNNQLVKGAGQANFAITNLNRVLQDSPFGFIGIVNNIDPLLNSFTQLKKEAGSTGGAFKALGSQLMGGAGLGLAITAITTAITFATIGFTYWQRKTQEVKDANLEFQKSIDEAGKSAISTGQKLQTYVDIARNGQLPLEQRNYAIREANKILGEHGDKLTLANVATERITRQVELYTQATIANAVAQKYADKIADLIIKKNDLLTKAKEQQAKIDANTAAARVEASKLLVRSLGNDEVQAYKALTANDKIIKSKEDLVDIDKELSLITKDISVNQEQLAQTTREATAAFGELGIKEKDKKLKKVKQFFIDIKKLLNAPVEAPIEFDVVDIKTDAATPQFLKDFYRNDLIKQITDISKQFVIPLEPEFEFLTTEGLQKLRNSLLSKKEQFQSAISNSFNNFLQNTAVNLGQQFAETLGLALIGQATLGDVFSGIFQQLAGGIEALGKQLIEIGTLAILAQQSLSTLLANPFAAIAVGIALTALGSAIKGLMGKQQFAVGTRFAPGGMALVGERGPEMVSLPRGSQVLPAAQTSAMLGGKSQVEVVGVLRGQDIYFSNKKYAQTYNRQT